jgi:hypothetical protein
MSSFDPRSPGTYSSFTNDKTQYTYDSDSGQRRACLSSQPRIDLNVTQTPLSHLQTHPHLQASSDALPSVLFLPALTTASNAVMTTVSQNMQKSKRPLLNLILMQRSAPPRTLSLNGPLPGRLTRPSPHLLRTPVQDLTLALPLRTYRTPRRQRELTSHATLASLVQSQNVLRTPADRRPLPRTAFLHTV